MKANELKILIGIEPGPDRDAIVRELRRPFIVDTVDDTEQAYDKIHHFDPDIAVLDYSLDKIHPINLHDGISLVHSYLVMVLCVTEENLQVAFRAWQKRSMNYILKPYTVERFVHDVRKIARHVMDQNKIKELRREVVDLKKKVALLEKK